jgi:hypothetical protein
MKETRPASNAAASVRSKIVRGAARRAGPKPCREIG